MASGGPFRRGGAAGMIVRRGYIVASGETRTVDVTFSVTKLVSTTVGLAYDRKMIRDLKEPVRSYMTPILALNGPPGRHTPLL